MRTGLAVTIALCLATALAIPSAAQAKSPPKGTYECVIGSARILFGDIVVKRGGKYRYSRFGKTGTFKAGKKLRTQPGTGGTRGYSISFKGGGMNKFKGYWFTSTTGTHEIALARPGSDFINIYCDD